MEIRTLGRTGIKVSHLCLGAMMFGPWGNEEPDECVRMVHTALAGGINFVDTADVYGQGESERIVGAALRGRRDDVVLATKFHGRMGDDPNRAGNSRRWIVQACEESLRRLQTDWIDLYQVHRSDPSCDIDETLGAPDDLLAGRDVALHDGTLDRIDDIVAPGKTLNPADAGYTPPSLSDASTRRRPA